MADTTDRTAEIFGNALSELKQQDQALLGDVAEMRILMQPLLQHEALRMEGKLGPQHPRTQQLKERLQSNLQVVHILEVERQLLAIDVPDVAEGGALVHGRIVDEDGLGIERLTVVLVDQSGTPARGADESTSNASGYFAISLQPETVDRLNKRYADGVFLAVFTPRRRLVLQQPRPLDLARSAVLLVRNIQLTRTDLTEVPSPPRPAVVVPNLVGMTESEASTVLQKVGLKLAESKTKVAPDQVGRVLAQSPAAGTNVDVGSSVSVVLGVQSPTIKVPSVIGRTLKDAKEEITKLGLIVGKISGKSQSDESIVRDQDPKPETEVPAGTPVNLVVAPPAKADLKDILERITTDEAFAEIGISVAKLQKRLEKSIATKEQLGSLLGSSDEDLKSSFGLPDINAAKALMRVLRKVLEDG